MWKDDEHRPGVGAGDDRERLGGVPQPGRGQPEEVLAEAGDRPQAKPGSEDLSPGEGTLFRDAPQRGRALRLSHKRMLLVNAEATECNQCLFGEHIADRTVALKFLLKEVPWRAVAESPSTSPGRATPTAALALRSSSLAGRRSNP